MKVRVEGKITWCYKCGPKYYIKADCSLPHVKAKGRQEGGKITGAPLHMEGEEREKEAEPQTKTSISIE